jgi:hypothetical protein
MNRNDGPVADKWIGLSPAKGSPVEAILHKGALWYSFAELIDSALAAHKRNVDVRIAELSHDVETKHSLLASRLRSSSHDLTDHVSTFEELADVLVQDRRATDAALGHHHARMGRIECAATEADYQTHAKFHNIVSHLHEVDRIAAADRAKTAVMFKCLDGLTAEIVALRAHARRTLDTESAVALVLRTGFIALLFAILAIYVDHEFARA